jgi:hypothetical protein
MRLSPSRSLRRSSMRTALLGAVVGGVAFARHRTISRHEIDLRAGPTEPAGAADLTDSDDTDVDHP